MWYWWVFKCTVTVEEVKPAIITLAENEILLIHHMLNLILTKKRQFTKHINGKN